MVRFDILSWGKKLTVALTIRKILHYKFRVENLALLVLLMEAVAFAWSAFKIIYLRVPANAIVSNTEWDKPAIRLEAYDQPRLVGIHYFGDFLQTFDWATLANPWTHDSNFLVQYPSVPVYLLKSLTLFPYFTAMWIYLSLMVISSATAVWLMLPRFSIISRLASSVAIGCLSAPALMAFDRGNSVGFIAILFCAFALAILKGKRWLAVAALVLLATTKIYPLLLIVIFIRLKWWREILITSIAGLALTLTLFAATPGNFVETFNAWIRANTEASGIWKDALTLGVKALLQAFGVLDTDTISSISGVLVETWGIVRYLIILSMLVLIVFKPRIQRFESLALGGFAMVLFYTAPHNYAWTWALPMVGILLNNFYGPSGISTLKGMWLESKMGVATLLGLLLVIIPLPIAVPGTQKSILPFIGYGVAFLVTYVGYREWFQTRRLKRFESR